MAFFLESLLSYVFSVFSRSSFINRLCRRLIEYVIKFVSFHGCNLAAYPTANAQIKDFAEQITDKNVQIRDRGG